MCVLRLVQSPSLISNHNLYYSFCMKQLNNYFHCKSVYHPLISKEKATVCIAKVDFYLNESFSRKWTNFVSDIPTEDFVLKHCVPINIFQYYFIHFSILFNQIGYSVTKFENSVNECYHYGYNALRYWNGALFSRFTVVSTE